MSLRIVDQYYLFPGKCYFTGSSSIEKPILDTGHHIEGEGRVYMSGEYLEEACRALGWHSPDEVDLLTADLVSARAQLDAALAELESMADIQATLADVAARIEAKKPPAQTPVASAATSAWGLNPPNGD